MSNLDSFIKNELKQKRKVLSVFLTAGYPTIKGFTDLALNALTAGADMIEIGIPFSDPIADGPVIQYSSQIALQNGINLNTIFNQAAELKSATNKPIILMGYANPILNYGTEKFINTCNEVKIDALIVPDVPLESYDDFFAINTDPLDTVLLVSPTSDKNRIKLIGEKSKGFVYCVSVKGITGERNNFSVKSLDYIKNVKAILPDKNVLVGFGISNPETAKQVVTVSDGVIVGSAIIKLLMQSDYKKVSSLISEIKQAIS